MSICLCKVKGHLSANFAKSKYICCCIFCQHHTNLTILNYNKMHVNGLEAMHMYINSVTAGQARIEGHLSV